MKREYLPLDSLLAWLRLNGIATNGVAVQKLDSGDSETDKGNAIIATADRSNDTDDEQILLQIPRDLVLSLESVYDYSKSDRDLREVLEAVGDSGRTARGAIMIFLLVQATHNSPQQQRRIGVSNPWTEYIKFLPSSFSLPTFWSEEERELLRGTSLEAAVDAKWNSLQKEFEFFHENTKDVAWCQQCWWAESPDGLTFEDWRYVDAAYRSRMLDLPGSGHSMVPCVDMVNHMAGTAVTALYDADSEGNAVLKLRLGKTLQTGEEVTISYGDKKAASEMIFSYGFLDGDMVETTQVMLDMNFPEADPLGVAKKMICKDTPGIRVSDASQDPATTSLTSLNVSGNIIWDSPLVWWLSVNEEDGLEIGIAQTTDGGRELEAHWKGEKIPSSDQLIHHLSIDPLVDIFRLRAVVLVLERLESQLILLLETTQVLEAVREDPAMLRSMFRPEIFDMVFRLRKLEATLLRNAVEKLTEQKNELVKSETVASYLEQAQTEEVEDFS
ncbi:hypothetical protein N7466_010948 [Penicillium verhagenii]|uniref:uncharacterized protein n=1 Tax=Penicillium verhagenii TaxID=1562060 RepID=UPI002545A867|nr:uncharacterized protein N7466_010948 [Penicillium verhagenii]KAJ5917394.1 hypothetical protein N7466_010948 [Penicillium verhagenii]